MSQQLRQIDQTFRFKSFGSREPMPRDVLRELEEAVNYLDSKYRAEIKTLKTRIEELENAVE